MQEMRTNWVNICY